MKSLYRSMLAAGLAPLAAFAHFVFVVPEPGGASAKMIISETLQPDEAVDARLMKSTKLMLRGADGKDRELTASAGEKFHTLALPGGGVAVHGAVEMGVMQLGRAPKPFLLTYYPKTLLGNGFGTEAVGGKPVELIPMGKPGALVFHAVANGKPLVGADVVVILPSGGEKRVKTDASGNTEVFTATGRYGAWTRFFEPGNGEREGKTFDELRHYATIVFDVTPRFATLPEATSSFGSVVDNGWLYVYGGHIAKTHTYDTQAVSGKFHRVRLDDPTKWEALPEGPALQGMNLAAYQGDIYLVGGMAPRNKPGDPADIHSTADVHKFDVKNRKWVPMPALNAPRSSHDVVVIDGKMIVSGGWNLKGEGQEWPATIEILDLKAAKPVWKTEPQPFKRRALMAAAHDGKMYVIGGLTDRAAVVRDVTVYDPKTNTWSEGPKLPASKALSFAPAAGVHKGVMYVSVSDGTLYRLNGATKEWDVVGKGTPRVAHRFASYGKNVLIIGGADKGANSDLVEAFAVGN
ncbi:hypothetical protein F183_A13800 [Bryobacterales bacterium F-183]|nr:hypothetical protein F183_A13800 [Bryobacterales bacterium F-183]